MEARLLKTFKVYRGVPRDRLFCYYCGQPAANMKLVLLVFFPTKGMKEYYRYPQFMITIEPKISVAK